MGPGFLLRKYAADAIIRKKGTEEKTMLDSLFARFDSIIVFDIETTGIDHKGDEIIELAALQMEMGPLGTPVAVDEFDLLIRLTAGDAGR